jgi:hypothetical protein
MLGYIDENTIKPLFIWGTRFFIRWLLGDCNHIFLIAMRLAWVIVFSAGFVGGENDCLKRMNAVAVVKARLRVNARVRLRELLFLNLK